MLTDVKNSKRGRGQNVHGSIYRDANGRTHIFFKDPCHPTARPLFFSFSESFVFGNCEYPKQLLQMGEGGGLTLGEKRVLLVDVDSQKGFPNLALMKISAYHKAQGHYVDLVKGIPDSLPIPEYGQAYISCIYFQNADAAKDYNK